MVQAAVIQIDGSAYGHAVIAYALLGVAEPGGVFKNAHAAAGENAVGTAGNAVGELLVRNARGDDAHIYAPAGGQGECPGHFIGNDQVRGGEPAVVLCTA